MNDGKTYKRNETNVLKPLNILCGVIYILILLKFFMQIFDPLKNELHDKFISCALLINMLLLEIFFPIPFTGKCFLEKRRLKPSAQNFFHNGFENFLTLLLDINSRWRINIIWLETTPFCRKLIKSILSLDYSFKYA